MRKSKSSISKASSYVEIGAYWDKHDATDFDDPAVPDVEFEVELQSEATYFALEKELSARIRSLAAQRGVSPETCLNLLVQEKLQSEAA